MFTSILIANRGEIACRIAATARNMGLRVIAIYSAVDKDALHVRVADDAYLVGDAPAGDSYLNMDRILAIAREARADCIHPGYGFLSENAEFARRCNEAGIAFVGPSPDAIEAMGLKDTAKQVMAAAGVPVVPGYQGDDQSADRLLAEAEKTGFPVMIKAVAGGGGKGMRLVAEPTDFDAALASCIREAEASFGDGRVLVEKFIANPRHIEVQIFGDTHGNVVHLFERDCSLQRRHQKVIEEAPAPGMIEQVRAAMTDAAVAAAKAVDYCGAGTVEFIVDGSDGLKIDGFYFMEMNTRLQVEHPVTELVTGVDLVDWQIRVAAGEKLPLAQGDIKLNGHAVQMRIYAEDPANGFLPQTGRLHELDWPQGRDLRIDTGVETGDTISPFYDPMIAKMIVWQSKRAACLEYASRSLRKTALLGVRNNISFLVQLLDHPVFRSATMDTGFIDRQLPAILEAVSGEARLTAAITYIFSRSTSRSSSSPWQSLTGWTLAGTGREDIYDLMINGEPSRFSVRWNADGFVLDNTWHITEISYDGYDFQAKLNGKEISAICRVAGATNYCSVDTGHYEISRQDLLNRADQISAGNAIVKAPMPGRVSALSASPGKAAAIGETLVIIEAMKMEHALKATLNGVVEAVLVSVDDQVEEGEVLVRLETESASQ